MLTTRAVLSGLLLAGAVATAVVFLPTQLGGTTSLIQTRGTSMQPAVRPGDVVVLRRRATYQVGDVIAYRSATLGAVMLHRIVRAASDGYVTRGDNNAWLDPDRPRPSDVIGRMWLRLPRGGLLLSWLSLPALLTIAAVHGALSSAQRGSPVRSRRQAGPLSRRRHGLFDGFPSPTTPGFVACSVLLGLAALWLGVASFRQPMKVSGTRPVAVRQAFTFGYSGRAHPGVVYPNGVLRWGDPIYPRLVDVIEITAVHQISGAGLGPVSGHLTLSARLEASNGWQGRLTPRMSVPLAGGPATTATLALPLHRITTLSAAVRQATGADLGALTIVIEAQAVPDTTVQNQSLTAPITGTLAFRFDGAQLVPTTDQRTTTSSAAVNVPEQQPHRLHVGSLAIPVLLARCAAIGLACAALILGITVWRVRRNPPPLTFEMTHRYHDRLVNVADFDTDLPILDVASASDLFKLADQTDALVLHYGRIGARQGYVLEHGAACYRFVCPVPPENTIMNTARPGTVADPGVHPAVGRDPSRP